MAARSGRQINQRTASLSLLTHSSSNQGQGRSLGPNNAMHMDSAMTLRLHIGNQWRGASDGDR